MINHRQPIPPIVKPGPAQDHGDARRAQQRQAKGDMLTSGRVRKSGRTFEERREEEQKKSEIERRRSAERYITVREFASLFEEHFPEILKSLIHPGSGYGPVVATLDKGSWIARWAPTGAAAARPTRYILAGKPTDITDVDYRYIKIMFDGSGHAKAAEDDAEMPEGTDEYEVFDLQNQFGDIHVMRD